MKNISIDYDQIKDYIFNLDILLFSADSPVIVSDIIKLLTWSKWNHVACVLKMRGEIYCWESTTLNRSKNIKGKRIAGVQLTPLKERIKEYKGDVAIRRLNIKRDKYFTYKLSQFKKQMDGKHYEENLIELFKSTFDLGKWGLNKKNTDSIFCSELIAEAMIQTNIIAKSVPSNEYVPKNFAMNLPFLNGYSFIDNYPIIIRA